MDFLLTIIDEVIGFLGLSRALEAIRAGGLGELSTNDLVLAIVLPIIPLLLIFEAIVAVIRKNPHAKVYKVAFLIYVFNRFVGRFVAIGMMAICVGLFHDYALFQTTLTWYWLIYGYVVWEFGHFVYHYLAHKVRLLWCLHSTHHAPESMNLSVNYAHFFLEGPYAAAIRTTICILLGVQPELLLLIMLIDGTYGAFIHLGENVMKDARFGLMQKWLLTPSHHRVHHARNPLYIDTNFCNLLNIWDRVFKTYQEEHAEVDIEYGISRPVDSGSFIDVYFGEFVALFRDVYAAPGLINKVRYLVMPPGWHHSGQHKTASMIREEYLQAEFS